MCPKDPDDFGSMDEDPVNADFGFDSDTDAGAEDSDEETAEDDLDGLVLSDAELMDDVDDYSAEDEDGDE